MVNQYLKHPSTYHHEHKLDRDDQDIYTKLKERSNLNFQVNAHAGKFGEEQLKEIIRSLLYLNDFQAESFNKHIITNRLDPIYENVINNFLLTMNGKIFLESLMFQCKP